MHIKQIITELFILAKTRTNLNIQQFRNVYVNSLHIILKDI